MKDILTLIRAELTKYIKLKSVLIGLIAIILIMIAVTSTEFMDAKEFKENLEYQKEIFSWQEREQNALEFCKELLADEWYTDFEKVQIQKRIDVAEYRLANNIPQYIYKNMWWFFNDNVFEWIIRLAIVVIILAGATNIGREYSDKTMTQMLLLPYKRWKILISKYMAMVVFGLVIFIGIFILGIFSGIVTHGTNGINAAVVINNGPAITTMSMTSYSMLLVLIKLVEVIFYISLTGFIAVILRSGAVSAVVSILAALIVTPASLFLSKYYSIFNYSPFNNLDFRRYLDFGTVMPSINNTFENIVIPGITPLISGLIVAITIVILTATTFIIFDKRDVT